ncbi:MAG TPA: cobalamin-dependent protein [Spirochaetia bacterium]|nr:cobalamin-dependent protein [Spirochaetia bacterium]
MSSKITQFVLILKYMTIEHPGGTRSVFAERLRILRGERGLRQLEVARKIGVAQTTIANYEQGTRFPEEATLRKIADLFGVSIDWLFGRTERVNAEAQVSSRGIDAETTAEGDWPHVEDYLSAIFAGSGLGATAVIADLENRGWTTRDIYARLFEPAFYECGRRWVGGEIDIAQEHYFTHMTEVLMAQLLSRSEITRQTDFSLVAVSTNGDLHNIGIRMVSDFLELEGWSTFFLGADLPTESVVGAVEKMKPSVLAVSATMYFAVDSVCALIGALRRNPRHAGTAIMVGGRAFNASPGLWRSIGADGYGGSANEAVACAKRLAGDMD